MINLERISSKHLAATPFYRADINGLRAVAVLAVIAFHTNINGFEGGYVGVDVFFVISGFLISKIIFEQIDAGRFNTARFYWRRFLRIVPALFVMILLTTAAGFALLYPAEISDFAKSAIAAIASMSNVLFWSSTGYFDTPAAAKPLLHTWSLGVEEQFYLLFPVLIIIIHRIRSANRVVILLVVLLLSLATSVFLVWTEISSAFYLPQSRIWEFLVGAMLSSKVIALPQSRLARETIAAIGLAAILTAVFGFSSSTPFPGFAALLPCLGTAAIIYAGSAGRTVAGQILSLPPCTSIGTISYSLYLYHWPLIVFQRSDAIINITSSRTMNRLLLLLVMFVLAYLSWRFVETPFRNRQVKSRTGWIALIATPIGVVVGVGVFILLSAGMPWRFSSEANRLASFLKYDPEPDMRVGSCFLDNRFSFSAFNKTECLNRRVGEPTLLLFGDSHAGHLYPGLQKFYGERANVLQATATGCKPLIRDIGKPNVCGDLIKYIFDTYLRTEHVDALILSARWVSEDIPFIGPTLDWLQQAGIRTILVGPTPEYDAQLPSLLARAGITKRSWIAGHLELEFNLLDREFQQIADRRAAIIYFSAYKHLCDSASCDFLANNEPLFYDKGHLTRSGSILLVDRMQKSIGPL